MKNINFRTQLLSNAILASTFFVIPLIARAENFGPGNTPGPVSTSTVTTNDGIIDVLATGSITGTGANNGVNINGVQATGIGGSVIVEPNNSFAGVNAISTTGTGAAISITAPNAVVTIGAGSGILGDGDAINVLANNTTINNSGTISGSAAGHAIFINVAAPATTTIVNNPGALITVPAGNFSTIVVDGSTLNLTNAGTILNAGNSTAVALTSPFTISNRGLINGINGGIFINQGVVVGPPTSSISNSGYITGITASAIDMNSGSIQGIINEASGVISFASVPFATIYVAPGSSVGTISNSGNIANTASTATTSYNAINLGTATSGIVDQMNGSITGNVLLAPAAANPIVAGPQNTLTVSGGTIYGNVTAATGVAGNYNLLTLSGGQITGLVTLGNQGDTVNLSGTALNQLTAGNGADTINYSGGSYVALNGVGLNDTVNTSGNTASSLGSTVNAFANFNVVSGMFISNGAIGTVTAPLGTGFNVNLNATMVANTNSSIVLANGANVVNNGSFFVAGLSSVIFEGIGSFQNNGTVSIGPAGTLVVSSPVGGTAGIFTGTTGSTFNPYVNGIQVVGTQGAASQMIVNDSAPGSVVLNAGSFILPTVNGFIPEGAVYNVIIVNNGGTITDNATLLASNSAIVSFNTMLTPAAPNTRILALVAQRNSFVDFSYSAQTAGVASALDYLAAGNYDQNNLNLLSQFDALATDEEVNQAEESLAPVINGLAQASQLGMERIFDAVYDRLEGHRKIVKAIPKAQQQASKVAPLQLADNGLNFGDPKGAWVAWGRVLGANLNQKERHGIDGYRANAIGLAVGVDTGINDCLTMGIAGSYTKTSLREKEVNHKDADLRSWQGTVYGLMELNYDLYLDAMFGIASNHYNTNRLINVNAIHTAANASFRGILYGGQADLAWRAVDVQDYYLAPFARLRYTHVAANGYNEDGADFLSLDVAGEDSHEFLGGLGFKVGKIIVSNEVVWIPELITMIGYDFNQQNQQALANWVGSPSFITGALTPGRTVFDMGLGLKTIVSEHSVLSVKYNLELRSQFVGNAGYLQYLYSW